MDELFKLLGSLGVGGAAVAFAVRLYRHYGEQYKNTAANMRSDIRAIDTQDILNTNLVEMVNNLTEKLEDERKRADEWRDKFYALRDAAKANVDSED